MLLANYNQERKEDGFHIDMHLHVEGVYDVNPKQLLRLNYLYMPPLCKVFMKKSGAYIVVQNKEEGISRAQYERLL